MTASAGAWYRVGTVNVTSGQQAIVGVGTNWQNDVIAIAIGDIFTVDSKTWYEVTAVGSDTSITLDRNFEGATAAGANYAIVRNTSGTILTRIAGQVSVQFNQKQLFLDELRTWLNSDNAAEELTDSHGVKQELKTPAQMVRDHDDKLAELDAIHPFPWAMRKVEFEARRAANNEKYAASGFVHKGKHLVSTSQYNAGLWAVNATARKSLVLGRLTNASGDSKTDYPLLHLAGVMVKIIYLNSTARDNYLQFPPAEDGTRTYDSETKTSVKHATSAIAFASETSTNEVVTDREDMWGFELFLREINDTDPFVYANGLIQSLAPTISGIGTVSDTTRPITYFAWFEGDDESRGKGVNWQTASESHRIAIASDPENNIYFDDATGKFYQYCVRGRSFAGLGNDSWLGVDYKNSLLRYSVGHEIAPQGILDYQAPTTKDSSVSYSEMYVGNYPSYRQETDTTSLGLFTLRDSSTNNDKAIGRNCYFLVCGTVNRLNQGAYHPLNPRGTSSLVNTNGSRVKWDSVDAERKIASKSECFHYYVDGGYVASGAIGGSIESSFSGRTDGRYYDAIYVQGDGGVCRDMRYSAWGLTAEDFSSSDLSIKLGTYRGKEYPTFTKVIDTGFWLNSAHSNKGNKWVLSSGICYVYLSESDLEQGYVTNLRSIVVVDKSKGITFRMKGNPLIGSSVVAGTIRCTEDKLEVLEGVIAGNSGATSSEIYLICEYLSKAPIAGKYLHTEVIAHPKNIISCDGLKDGFEGIYNHQNPDGERTLFNFTRAYAGSGSDIIRKSTIDNGTTWTGTTNANLTSTTDNSISFVPAQSAEQVNIYQYLINASPTESSITKEVYSGNRGLGVVHANALGDTRYGSHLGNSLLGKVITGNASNLFQNTMLKNWVTLLESGKLHTDAAYPHIHNEITIRKGGSVPTGLIGFKALNYNVVENQQGFINYAYTELKHDGTDWGDDSKIHIADNQTTMLDENGNTVLVGTAQIVEPLGWIKNDK